MDDYAPRSPDLSALSSYTTGEAPQKPISPPSYAYSPQRQDSFSLPQSSYYQPPTSSLQHQSSSADPRPPHLLPESHGPDEAPVKQDPYEEAWAPLTESDAPQTPQQQPLTYKVGRKGSSKAQLQPSSESNSRLPAPGDAEHIVIKTKFPVARIKRLVQADEEVGKVAQVTPPVVGKALELFMIQMTLSSAAEAQSRGSKRLTSAHIKAAIMGDDTFDFLKDIGDKIPDGPSSRIEGRERKVKGERLASDDDLAQDSKTLAKRRGGGKKKRPAEED